MNPIELYSALGQANIDKKKQRALFVAWLLLTTNPLWTDHGTTRVKTDADLAKVKAVAATSPMPVYYLDMRKLYPTLTPLTEQEVDQLFALPASQDCLQTSANLFKAAGASVLQYTDHYCTAMQNILALNPTAKSTPKKI